jgi:hypothetical protein
MSSDLVLVVGGAISCFGLGWSVGRGIKMIRQFFDQV